MGFLLRFALSASVLMATLPFCPGEEVLPFTKCPTDMVPMTNFDLSQYMGLWYQYESAPGTNDRCITATHISKSDGKFGITISKKTYPFGISETIKKIATPVGSGGEAKYKLTDDSIFSFLDVFSGSDPNYFVLATDYTSYAIVWNCRNELLGSIRNLQILTREREPNSTVVQEINTQISALRLDASKLKKTDQDC